MAFLISPFSGYAANGSAAPGSIPTDTASFLLAYDYGLADNAYGKNDGLYGKIDDAYGAIDDLYGYIDDQYGKLDTYVSWTNPEIEAEIDRARAAIVELQGGIEISYRKAEDFSTIIDAANGDREKLLVIIDAIEHEIDILDRRISATIDTFEFGLVYHVSLSVDRIYEAMNASHRLIDELYAAIDRLVVAREAADGGQSAQMSALIENAVLAIGEIRKRIKHEYQVASAFYNRIGSAREEESLYELEAQAIAEAESFYASNKQLASAILLQAESMIESADGAGEGSSGDQEAATDIEGQAKAEAEQEDLAGEETIEDRPGSPEQPSEKNPDTTCSDAYEPACGNPNIGCADAQSAHCNPYSNNYTTYRNMCELEKAAAAFLYEGECQDRSGSTGQSNEQQTPSADEQGEAENNHSDRTAAEQDAVVYFEDAEDGTTEKWQQPSFTGQTPRNLIKNIFDEELQSRVIKVTTNGVNFWISKPDEGLRDPIDTKFELKFKTANTYFAEFHYYYHTSRGHFNVRYRVLPDQHNGEWTKATFDLGQHLEEDEVLYRIEQISPGIFQYNPEKPDRYISPTDGVLLLDDIAM